MAVNMYEIGHYLPHDDCNPKSKNRRLSFILYLTDLDKPWVAEWGGGLRLYATESATGADDKTVRVVGPIWAKWILPFSNQLVFFGVLPGEAYHEVEQVTRSSNPAVGEERCRITISGWFYAPQEGDQDFDAEFYRADAQKMERLHELKAAVHTFREPLTVLAPFTFGKPDGLDTTAILSPEDIRQLSRYLEPDLLAQDQLEYASRRFAETCSLHLEPFLSTHFEAELSGHLER